MSDSRFQEISAKLDEVRQMLAELRASIPFIEQRVQRLEKEIWGNGRAGLSVRVNAVLWMLGAIITLLAVFLGADIKNFVLW